MVTVEVAETEEGVMEVLTKELNPMTGRTPDLGTNHSEKPTTHSCTAERKCRHGGEGDGYSWGTPLGDGPCSTRGWADGGGWGGVGYRYNAESRGLNLSDNKGGGGCTWGYTRCSLGEVTGSGGGSNFLTWGGTPLKHTVAQPMSVASGGIGYGAWATGLGGASPHPWWYGMGFDGEHKAVAPPAPTSASTRKIVNSSSERCRVKHERLGSSSADKNSGSKPVTGTRDPMKPESFGPADDDAIQRMLARRCTDTAGFHSRLALAAEADHYEPHPEDGSLESSADEEGGVGSLSGFSLWRDRSAVSFGSARTHRAKTVLEVMEEEKGTNSDNVNDSVSVRSGSGNRNDLGGAGAGASSLLNEAPAAGCGGVESFTDGVPMATYESGNPYLGLAPVQQQYHGIRRGMRGIKVKEDSNKTPPAKPAMPFALQALRASPLPKPSFLSLEGAGEPEEEVAFDRTFDFPFSYGDGLGGNADSVATCWNNDDAVAAASAAAADVRGTPGFSLWDALDFDHPSGDLCDAGVRRGGATSGVCLPNGEHGAVGDDEADEAALVSAAERVLEGEDGEVSSSVETLPSNGRAAWSVVNAPTTVVSAASVAAVADGQPRGCSANASPAVAAAEVGHRRRRSTLTRCCWSIEEETRKGQSVVDGANDDRTSSSMGAAAGDKDGERGEDATSPASLAHVGQCKTEGATAGATGLDEVGEASGTGTRWSELFASARTTNTDGHRGRILTVGSIDRSGSCAKGGSTICGHAHGNGTANGVPLVDSAPPSPADAEAVGPTVTVGKQPNSGGGSSFTTNTTTNSISSGGSSGSSGTVEIGGRNQVSSSGRMLLSGSKPAPDGSVVGAQTSAAGCCANSSNSSNSSSNSSSSSIDGREGLAGVPILSRDGRGIGDGGRRSSLRVGNDAGGGGAGGAQSGCGGRSDGGGGGSVEPCGDGQRSQDSSTRTARSSTNQGAAKGEDEDDAAPADTCTGGHDNDANITGTAVAWEETSGQLLDVEEVLRNLTLPPEPPLRAMLPDADAGGHAVAGEGLPPPNAAGTSVGDTLNSGIIGGGSGSGGGVVNDGDSGGGGADLPSSAVAPAASRLPSASWLSRAASCSPAGALRGWTQRAAAIVVAATGSATTPAGPSPARGASVARAGPMRPEGKRTNEDGRKPPGAAEKVRLGAGWRTHVAAPLHRVDFSYCWEEWGVRGARRTSQFVDGSPL